MIVVEKNEGEKIPYEVSGTKICFDDDLTINLAKREEDWSVHIDVCSDKDGALVIGAAAGRAYVAEIDIPAREYEEKTVNIDGEEQVTNTPVPLDMDKVTLTLWAID
jgi:hypothetical protein